MAWDETAEKIWFDGELINWQDAKIHVLSHVVHYGTSVFEGIRCYDTKKGSAIFRLEDHIKRLFSSGKIYRMEVPYTVEEICEACKLTITENNLKSGYIRPIVFRGYGEIGVNPLGNPINAVVASWEWGKYLGDDALENGVDVTFSTWRRLAPDTMPSMAKAGANYMNSQLAKMEAIEYGFDEAIMLDYGGMISEGSGENIFIVQDDVIYTPNISSSILNGITRKSIITLAKEFDYEVVETALPREMVYSADEMFFSGTAAEITPIRSVDKITIGEGKRGPVAEKLQNRFFDIVEGNCEDEYGWLTYL